ncbi:MAG: serine/threonine-protein kinase [Planctomycetota bacterium]
MSPKKKENLEPIKLNHNVETSTQKKTATGASKRDGTSTFPEIEGFSLTRVIGQGGMGIVFEALDESLQRSVAIKTLSSTMVNKDVVERLDREAKLQAILDHPHIVRLLDYGWTTQNHREVPYLVMEYVDGDNLRDHIENSNLTYVQIAELLAKLADALALCHSRGVVHRDLKPGNVLIAVDGEPKLTDFGLGRLFEERSRLTKTGNIMGTPAYMSPEQAGGAVKNIGPAADIYALGAILYELLGGEPPFEDVDPLQTVVQILTHPPASLRATKPEVPTELEAIALECLEKQPKHRYATASGLAEDLRRFLRHQPITARPTPLRRRAWLWVRRNPLLSSIAAFLSMTVVIGLVGAWLHVQQLNDEIRRSKRIIEHGRSMSHWLLDDFSNDLDSPEGITFISNQLADRTQTYLDSLLVESPGDVELAKELAFAYSRLAELQGLADGSSLGQTSTALENLAKAEQLVETLIKQNVSGIERVRIDIAAQKTALAIQAEDYETARSEISKIKQLLTTLEADGGARKLSIELNVFASEFEIGFAEGDRKEMQRCIDLLKQTQATLQETFPSEYDANMLALVYVSKSQERLFEGSADASKLPELLAKSRTSIEHLLTKHPSQRGASFLANIDNKLGDTFFRQNRFQTALGHYRSALAIWLDFEKRDRQNTVVLRNLAMMNQNVGECLIALNQFDEAAIAMDEAELAYQHWIRQADLQPLETSAFLLFLGAKSRLSILNGDVEAAREQNDQKLFGFRQLKGTAPNRRAIGDALVFRTLIEVVNIEQRLAEGADTTTEDWTNKLSFVRQCQSDARDHFESMKRDNLGSNAVDSQLKTIASLDKTLENWETQSKNP